MTGDELRAWMTANGYSVRVLAAMIEVDPRTVQRWRENQVSRMGVGLLVALHAEVHRSV